MKDASSFNGALPSRLVASFFWLKRFISLLLGRCRNVIKVVFGNCYVYPVNDYQYHQLCFSQSGEDIFLMNLLYDKPMGFYIDIGAHRPMRFSNTYLFYLRGWSGICIDASSECIAEMHLKRPRDRAICAAIAEESGFATYFRFHEPAFNTLSKESALRRIEIGDAPISCENVPIYSLKSILGDLLECGQPIDFMSVDVEGMDLAVLMSNDWDCYRPKFILAERRGELDAVILPDETNDFLANCNYRMIGLIGNTLVFIDCRYC